MEAVKEVSIWLNKHRLQPCCLLSIWMWASHLLVSLRRARDELDDSSCRTVGAAIAAIARLPEMMMFFNATIVETGVIYCDARLLLRMVLV